MVTDQLMETLSKQGYKIIGSHSGVKLCRWTKACNKNWDGFYTKIQASLRTAIRLIKKLF